MYGGTLILFIFTLHYITLPKTAHIYVKIGENITIYINRDIELLFFCYLFTFILYFTPRITGTRSHTVVYCDWKNVVNLIQ